MTLRKQNLQTARSIFGHFVPAMGIAQKPAEGGPHSLLSRSRGFQAFNTVAMPFATAGRATAITALGTAAVAGKATAAVNICFVFHFGVTSTFFRAQM